MKAEQFDLIKKEKPLNDTSGKIYVMGYRRSGGTFVKAHWRKLPRRQIGTGKVHPTSKEQLSLF